MMVLIGLHENLDPGLRLWGEFKELDFVNLYVLVCNNSKSGIIRRLSRLLKQFLKLDFKNKSLFFRLLLKRQLKITLSGIYNKKTLNWIKEKNPDIGIHGGMVDIYKKNLISLFKIGILNSHIGRLPQYRGRSVMEWSIFNNDPTGITEFFIDEGIDTGENIVFFNEISVNSFRDVESAKKYLFSLSPGIHKHALELLVSGKTEFMNNNVSQGKRYYPMSTMFRNIVNELLNLSQNTS
jgi:methionyl-tRNA formyltransferase